MPINAIFEEFICPICLSPITDCYITPCGHNACNDCLQEWISRQHTCPVCVAPDITVGKLVKNLCFDNIYSKVCEERAKASARYFKNITANGGVGGAGDGSSVAKLSPIEAVFQRHMQASLSGYTTILAELETKFQKRREDILSQYTARIDGIRAAHKVALRITGNDAVTSGGSGGGLLPPPPSTPSILTRTASLDDSERTVLEATAWRDEQIAIIQRLHDDAVAALVSEYDQYMAAAVPSPSLLPAVITVSVPSRGWKFQVKLRPTDYLRDVMDAVSQRVFQGFGETVQQFNPDCQWVLGAVTTSSSPSSSDTITFTDTTPLYAQCRDHRMLPGSDVVCTGTVTLKSDVLGKCFAKEFVAGSGQTMDYFSCEQCACNWICAECAKHCHKGHTIRPHVMNHRPSYGCCYCNKKKLCKLPA